MHNKNDFYIGVMDSGIGGLSVVKYINDILPHENLIYFGDIARLPYGTKSQETIKKYAVQCTEYIISKNIKAIIIACNTVSAIALSQVLALSSGIPVIDVITCAVDSSYNISINNNIGIIATPATVSSLSYVNKLKEKNSVLNIFQKSCTLFVPLIEEGYIDSPALEIIAQDYLNYFIDKNIDTLILGCTHYPLIKKTISKILTNKITLIDPAVSTVNKLEQILKSNDLLNKNVKTGIYKYFITEYSANFIRTGELFLNRKINNVELVNL